MMEYPNPSNPVNTMVQIRFPHWENQKKTSEGKASR